MKTYIASSGSDSDYSVSAVVVVMNDAITREQLEIELKSYSSKMQVIKDAFWDRIRPTRMYSTCYSRFTPEEQAEYDALKNKEKADLEELTTNFLRHMLEEYQTVFDMTFGEIDIDNYWC